MKYIKIISIYIFLILIGVIFGWYGKYEYEKAECIKLHSNCYLLEQDLKKTSPSEDNLVTKTNLNPKVSKILKGTNWTSQFYHYCNYYHFSTDSTGYSEDGQVGWSCPVDSTNLRFSGNEILYENQKNFKYEIVDTTLVIEYLNWRPHNTTYQRVFHYRPKHHDWISEYEYAYGKECLKKGEKKELLEFKQ